jgi:hypothetical protein
MRSRGRPAILATVKNLYGLVTGDIVKHANQWVDGEVFIYRRTVPREEQEPELSVSSIHPLFSVYNVLLYSMSNSEQGHEHLAIRLC